MINGKLKLNNNYLGKSYEIILDNNTSFDELKSKIIEEFNLTNNNQIYIKFFDIKFDKKDSDIPELKISLLNSKEINKDLVESNQLKDKGMKILKDKINSLKNEINLINEEYRKNIKAIEENYESFKDRIITQSNENYNSLKREICELLEMGNQKEDKMVGNDEEIKFDNINEYPLLNKDKEEKFENEIINIKDYDFDEGEYEKINLKGSFEQFENYFNFKNIKVSKEKRRDILEKLWDNDHSQFSYYSEVLSEKLLSQYVAVAVPNNEKLRSVSQAIEDSYELEKNNGTDFQRTYYLMAYALSGQKLFLFDGEQFRTVGEFAGYLKEVLSQSYSKFESLCHRLVDYDGNLDFQFEIWLTAIGKQDEIEQWRESMSE